MNWELERLVNNVEGNNSLTPMISYFCIVVMVSLLPWVQWKTYTQYGKYWLVCGRPDQRYGLLIVLKNNYGNIAKVNGLNNQVAPVMVHVSKHIT